MTVSGAKSSDWSIDELRVLAAIYFNASFSIGDDARDECRTIADCFERTPSSIDRQWRNMHAVVVGKAHYNIGQLVRHSVSEYLSDPAAHKRLAMQICEHAGWPLKALIEGGKDQAPMDLRVHTPEQELIGALRDLCDMLEYKSFSSGSQGFFRQGKIARSDGRRYQSQISAVLIGSKANLTVHLKASQEEIAQAVKGLLAHVGAKTFSTGKVGYFGNGKCRVRDEKFQVQIQAVQIGTT
jgi:hypothetical protein